MSRLYTVVDDYDESDYYTYVTDDGHEIELRKPVDCPHPDEWIEFCLARWGEVKPFFIPAVGRIYKSRSAAVERAALIRYWGGKAKVLECSPEWRTIEEASRERKRRRIHARVTKLEDALAAERAKFAEASA